MSDQFSLFDERLEPVAPPEPPERPAPAPGPLPDIEATRDPMPPAESSAPPERDLDVVRAEALVCVRCALSRTRTHVVFGEGNPQAPLVFVGEGPGENEDATGRPFVGRAGKLLDEVLLRNGMTRRHVYICNTIKCRATNVEGGRVMNRPPTLDEISACQPWLEEQLGLVKPLVIVCLGAPAANTVIHKGFRMLAERGRWFTTSPYAPWVTATYHPAYVLRLQGAAYDAALATLVEDIAAARKKVVEVRRELKEAAATPPTPRSLFD